ELAGRQPRNLAVRFRLLELNFTADSRTEMERWLREIKNLEGGVGPFTAYGEAAQYILLSEGKDQSLLAKAHAKLNLAGSFRPSWPRVAWLRGLIYDVARQRDKALESYQKAIELGDRRQRVYRRVLELMREQGMFTEANELLKELPQTVK